MSGHWSEYAIPVVGFVGLSGSGKTTFLEAVIRTLAERGWRVGTAKHHHAPDFEIDVPGKDSWRHGQAGAVVSMISSEKKLGVVRRLDRERTIEELIGASGGDIDILLTESFRVPGVRQIEVVRTAHSDRLTCRPDDLFALVTDGTYDVGEVPVFSLGDVEGVVALIEGTLLAVDGSGAAADGCTCAESRHGGASDA